MDNPYLDKEKEIAENEAQLKKHKWKCMCPRCDANAINSHLLQRNGILDNVVEAGHLYELRNENYFKWHEGDPVVFRKVGILQAISYPLFCSKHDTEIFKPIESGKVDFDDYLTQLLFSYRAVCAEIRKKEKNLIRYEIWPDGEHKEGHTVGTETGIKDLNYCKYLFEAEINKPKRKFTFFHLTYSKINIYSSATFSYEPVDYGNERSVNEALNKKVWDAVYISIIPQKETTEIIIGYHNNHANKDLRAYVDSWKDLSFEKLQIKLTDLFVARVETWGLSPSLFDSISDEEKEWFIKTQSRIYTDYYYNIKQEVDHNFFEV